MTGRGHIFWCRTFLSKISFNFMGYWRSRWWSGWWGWWGWSGWCLWSGWWGWSGGQGGLDVLWVLCVYVFLVPRSPRHESIVNRLTYGCKLVKIIILPHRGNSFLFRSSQQLPCLHLGPLKGFLSWYGALQWRSTRLVRCLRNYRESRTPSGVPHYAQTK